MSKKTNSLSLRLIKNKNWESKSFIEDFNYSKILYQDLYIVNYLKNILQYQLNNSIVQDIIIQRKWDVIHINVLYYPLIQKKKFKNLPFIFRKHRWRSKKRFFFRYLDVRKKRVHKYQKYLLKVVKSEKKKAIPLLFRMRLFNKNNYLSIFSLKRLILLNLTLLTRCSVKLYFSNLKDLANFPFNDIKMFNVRDIITFIGNRRHLVKAVNKRKLLSKNIENITYNDCNKFSSNEKDALLTFFKEKAVYSVWKIMNVFKLKSVPARIVGLDIFILIHLVFTSFIFKSPNLLGVYLSRLVKKNIKSFNIFYNFLYYRVLKPLFIFSGLRGLKIQFKGRLGSSLRKKTSVITIGSLPLQTINSDIRYSFNESITIYGVCGIKIWYYY